MPRFNFKIFPRYRRISMRELTGITQFKRNLSRKLHLTWVRDPTTPFKNANRRMKRQMGYYSAPMQGMRAIQRAIKRARSSSGVTKTGDIESSSSTPKRGNGIERATNRYTPDGQRDNDILLNQAIAIAYKHNFVSASLFQRHLQLNYSQASLLIDRLEQEGIVGHSEGGRPCPVLITREE